MTDGVPHWSACRFGPRRLPVWSIGLVFAAAGLGVSQYLNYEWVFLRRRRYEIVDPMRQMLEPYPRLVTLHVVIIVGAVLAGTLGQPLWLVVLLVLFKIAFEVAAHIVGPRFETQLAPAVAATERKRRLPRTRKGTT